MVISKASKTIDFSLKRVIALEDGELFYDLKLYLKSRYDIIETDNYHYLYCLGNSPFSLMAHLDTLRFNTPLKLMEKNGNLTNHFGILGADDRAGIYAAISAIENCYRTKIPMPSFLLTNLEELGFQGIKKFIDDDVINKFKYRPKFFINLDRQGFREYVTYGNPLTKEIDYFLSMMNIAEVVSRSCADNHFITQQYNIPSINLAVGYYNEHTDDEVLNIHQLDTTIKLIRGMMATYMLIGDI